MTAGGSPSAPYLTSPKERTPVSDDDFKKMEYAAQRLEGSLGQLLKRIETLEKILNFLACGGPF
jgi:hypothetical protein